MAFKKSQSAKCPVCVGCSEAKKAEINAALSGLLEDMKETGEIPKVNDSRIQDVAHLVSVAPHSIRFHLKTCLVGLEIQDQRFQELKDLTELLSTAKQSYTAMPSVDNASSLNQLMTQWRGLASEVEGQFDPSTTVEFIAEAVLSPIARETLVALATELRELRETMGAFISENQKSFVKSEIDGVMSRVSTALKESVDDGLKHTCEYYKVELEAQSRKRALDNVEKLPLEPPTSEVN